jgi:hypothetical protein
MDMGRTKVRNGAQRSCRRPDASARFLPVWCLPVEDDGDRGGLGAHDAHEKPLAVQGRLVPIDGTARQREETPRRRRLEDGTA